MKILIIKNRAMGDSVIGLGAVQFLKKLHPNDEVVYGVPSWVAPLYSNVGTNADRIVPISLKSLGDWWALLRFMWREQFDIVIEMHQSGRTRKFFSFARKLMGFRYFYHNHNLSSGTEVHDQGIQKPNIQRDLDGVWSAACRYLSEKPGYPHYLEYTPKLSLSLEKKNRIILGVVATRETKMWPLDHFVVLAKKLIEHYQCEVVIPLSPSEIDQNIKMSLKDLGMPDSVEFLIRPLDQLPAELGTARLYIGNDTGLKHIAIALGIPSVSFFGPERPLEWHPYDTQMNPYFFIDGLKCRTDRSHFCGLHQCDVMDCMNGITVDEVFSKCKELLS